MFEDYLEDAYHFAKEGNLLTDDKEANRYYRASIFYSISAVEAFVNFVGDTFLKGGKTEPYEVAFLLDRKFWISGNKFEVLEKIELHRLEDKLKYLIKKYVRDFEFEKEVCWSKFIEFKRFRNNLVHPSEDTEGIVRGEYLNQVTDGFPAVISIMDTIFRGVFGKPLRRSLVDLTI